MTGIAGMGNRPRDSKAIILQETLVEQRKRTMTQPELAGLTGLAQGTISQLENNIGGGTLDLWSKYAQGLGFRFTLEKCDG